MSAEPYSRRIRVRSCGLITSGNDLLLVQIDSPTRTDPIWIPPGGEVTMGETLREGVAREVLEETGLNVDPVRLSLVHEYIAPPFHAIEFYFICTITGGSLRMGGDPERSAGEQILMDLAFKPLDEVGELNLYPEVLRSESSRYLSQNGPPGYITTS